MSNKCTGLKEIRFEITRHCNCRCFFCHNQNTFLKKERLAERDLNTDQIKYIIDQVVLAKIPRIRFTGGEPLIRPDVSELIIYAKSKELHVRINTNGTLINDKNIEVLKEYVDVVLISIPTNDEKKNDSILKLSGGFRKKLEAIKSLKKTKPNFLWGCTVATNENIEELEKIVDFVYSNGFDYWFCLRQMPIFKNKNPYAFDDCKKLIEKLLIIKEKYKDKYYDGEILNNAFPFCAYDKDKVNSIASGAIYGEGHSSLVIDPSGNVLVDYCYDEIMGNVFKESLEKIWNSERVKSFRELKLLPKRCYKCKYLKKCKGGSRVASLMSNKRIDGKDPLMML